MRVLVDAQLPRRLAHALRELSLDAVHTLDLPDGNRTSDVEITRLADAQDRVVVTKDADFVTSHLLRGSPRRLWLISTGNLSNRDLERIMRTHIDVIQRLFETETFVELTRDALRVRTPG